MSILIKSLDMPKDEGVILAIYNGKAKQIGTDKEWEVVEVDFSECEDGRKMFFANMRRRYER